MLFLLVQTTSAQQLPDRSYFNDLSFVWNPAMTGESQHWEAFASYRQQWMGFEDSPRTATIGAQFPLLDYNMSLGGFIIQDFVQPFETSTVGFNYAYQLELGLVGDDVLSIGLMGTMSQFAVNSIDIVVNDIGDVLVPIDERSKMVFNSGVGLYYVSHSNAYSNSFSDESYFFMGLAANQLIPMDTKFSQGNDNYKRAIHANAIIGARIISDEFFIEPLVWANYSEGNVFSANMGAKIEFTDLFWGGIAIATNQSATVQAGYIHTPGSSRFSTIRIGSLATINTGSLSQPRGVSYEFYLAYRYSL